MSLSVDQLGKAIVAAGLMPADELKAVWTALPVAERPKDAAAFAQLLVKRGALTEFQSQELLVGSGTPLVLGDYVLLDKIGAGGMGQVFKAQHRHMDRLVAIKLLPAAMTKDEAAVKRFQREVKAAARLSHPNIVQAHDASVQRGVWYLVMECVEGRDLSALVAATGPLPVERAVDYILQTARGLAFAHENGVVHRDIKPANLLLDRKGTVKILDMGLARIDSVTATAAAQDGLTQSGQVMGTVDYMAPEQAFDTHSADARADIYSLGCTLFRLLTGQSMYNGDTIVQKLLAHQSKPIPSLTARRVDVPAVLGAIFERMVAKRPEDRYQTMAEVEAELRSLESPHSSRHTPCAVRQPGESYLDSADGTRSMPATMGVATVTHLNAAPPKADDFSPTIALDSTQHTTDPVSDRSIEVARQVARGQESFSPTTSPSRSGSAKKTPNPVDAAAQIAPRPVGQSPTIWRQPLVLLGGLAGALLLVFGIWLIIRDKDGNEVVRVKVPEGGTATFQTAGARANAPARTTFGEQPPLAKAPFDAAQARAHQEAWAKHLGTTVETTNSVGAKMILIPPGEFLMGSSDEQIATAFRVTEDLKVRERIQKSERPQHRVMFGKPFLMGATEVTIGQFKKFSATGFKTEAEKAEIAAKAALPRASVPGQPASLPPAGIETYLHPGHMVTDDSPAAVMTWNDAAAYCNWLSNQENLEPCYRLDVNTWLVLSNQNGYRLPTEAEWEYACRAGTTTQYSFGDDANLLAQFAWYNNDGGRSHAVGTKPPNAFGLFDMHGNVAEWCQDLYDEKWDEKHSPNAPNGPASYNTRVLRGGYWNYQAPLCRSAFRNNSSPSFLSPANGFRIVRMADGEEVDRKFEISNPESFTPPLAKAPFDAAQARSHQDAWAKHLGTTVESINSVGAKMILIPPGEFWMGSTDEQVAAALLGEPHLKERILTTERPQRSVVISHPFLVGATEVTIGQFKKFSATGYQTEAEKDELASKAAPPQAPKQPAPTQSEGVRTYLKPGYAVTDDSPAAVITWNDAVAYCNWLSKQEKLEPCYRQDVDTWLLLPNQNGYRLPAEAEWEYACRAGTTTQFSFGDDVNLLEHFGWFNDANGRAHTVGTKPPNAFGLFDMHGNLVEWCQDFFDEKWYEKNTQNAQIGPVFGVSRVLRGGWWQHRSSLCRSAFRDDSSPSYRSYANGFRCVRVLEGKSEVKSDSSISGSSKPPPANAPFDAAEAKAHQDAWASHLGTQVETTNRLGMRMTLIPPGEFLMGSTDEQVDAALKVADEFEADESTKARIRNSERPQHRVVLTKPLLMGATEVTIGQFQQFVEATNYITQAEQESANSTNTKLDDKVTPEIKKANWQAPGYAVTANSPVTQVAWNDACAFCNWLSESEQRTACYQADGMGSWFVVAGANGYRLPTEAEWEYACRAGTATQFSSGDEWSLLDQYAWYNSVSQNRAWTVGLKPANAFGLHDMHGNVYEWCQDLYDEKWYLKTTTNDPNGPSAGSGRVVRGGHWTNHTSLCRSAYRSNAPPSYHNNYAGFRCVCRW